MSEITERVNENILLTRRSEGLTLGTDALFLAAFIRGGAKSRACELGSGTGIISLLLLSRNKAKSVLAVEVQEEYASLSAKNADENGFSERMTVLRADIRDIRLSDFGGRGFDCVFANPPYMKSDSGKPNVSDEKNIARHEVFGDICDFAAAASRILRFGGSFYTVYRPDRATDLIAALRGAGLEPKRAVFIHPDAYSPPSLILTEARLGAGAGMKFSPPLFIYADRKHTRYTARTKDIYEKGTLE